MISCNIILNNSTRWAMNDSNLLICKLQECDHHHQMHYHTNWWLYTHYLHWLTISIQITSQPLSFLEPYRSFSSNFHVCYISQFRKQTWKFPFDMNLFQWWSKSITINRWWYRGAELGCGLYGLCCVLLGFRWHSWCNNWRRVQLEKSFSFRIATYA